MLYSIKIGFFKKIKNVKGHIILKENPNILMAILENEERVFINLMKVKKLKFSREWFDTEKKLATKDFGVKS